MNEFIKKARIFLDKEKLDYLYVNSTNEFLVEYNTLEKNSRYHLTAFSGSTGDAVISRDNIFLFVDGRYHVQADEEVNHDDVTVVKLQIGDKVIDALAKVLDKNTTIGLCSKKNSQTKYENIVSKLKEKKIKVKLIDKDPLDLKLPEQKQNLTDIPYYLTGMTSDEKIQKLTSALIDDEAILVTNLEDLSYLYNKRNFEKENSCSIEGKAILTNNTALMFKDENLSHFDYYVKDLSNINTFYVDCTSITAHDYNLVKDKAKKMDLNPITYRKCVKTEEEIEHYKEAFKRTDMALTLTREFIEKNNRISEYDIKVELEKNFKNCGAVSQSFTSIIAKDANSALAHYSKSSKNEVIKNGSLVLIDCGGFFEGGLATDITRVFVKGKPNELQKQVYTTVLKAFLKAYNLREFSYGYDIDKVARDFLEKNAPEGFVFNHGLGHGIGINVHEAPPRLSAAGMDSRIFIKNNMCFTIEPGLYKKDYFGVRLENSCYYSDDRIHSFSNMCYEKKLIDFSMLDEQEEKWLSEFEVK